MLTYFAELQGGLALETAHLWLFWSSQTTKTLALRSSAFGDIFQSPLDLVYLTVFNA